MTSIGGEAFEDCYSLTSIELPSSVTSIGALAFDRCSSLSSITIDENSQNYKSIDGNLYSKDGKTLIQYAIGKTATSFS
ncbi:MAG: leucine-rich repeat protein, partial [Clostridia bacterium]|nr:leucine-rich repeat protein [Clostridia bacterium]